MGLISLTRYNITCDKCGEIYCDDDNDSAEILMECAIDEGWVKTSEGDNWQPAGFICPECASKLNGGGQDD